MIGFLIFKTHCFLRIETIKIVYRIRSSTFHPEDAILVFGSPRSGTTWLAEILSAPKGHTPIIEPIKLHHLRHTGYREYPYIPTLDKDKKTHDYFMKIFSGEIADGYNTYHTHLLKVLNTKQWVIKFIKGNRMLPWILNNFTFRKKPVFVIRHPCGVVYSQLKHPFVPKPSQIPEDDTKILKHIFGKVPEFVRKVKTKAGIKAITWALDNIIPLKYSPRGKLILVSYEKLILEGEKELKRIYSEWNLSVPEEAIGYLRRRSKEARSWSEFDKRGRKKLGVWKRYLTQEEIKEILSVVHGFGFLEFTENLEPDYNMLYHTHLLHAPR